MTDETHLPKHSHLLISSLQSIHQSVTQVNRNSSQEEWIYRILDWMDEGESCITSNRTASSIPSIHFSIVRYHTDTNILAGGVCTSSTTEDEADKHFIHL